MQSIVTIFREVRDPRDVNARHDLGAPLLIAPAATPCGAKGCVDIANFADAHGDRLGKIDDLTHGAPGHDSFSRLFRLRDPGDPGAALTRFAAALRRAEGGDEVGATLAALKSLELKGGIVTAAAVHCHPRMAQAVRATGAHHALGLKANHGPLRAAAFARKAIKGTLPFFPETGAIKGTLPLLSGHSVNSCSWLAVAGLSGKDKGDATLFS